ncbi:MULTISPECIES: HTH-type transcriptional regulator ArgP [Paraburkholderia]|uniref:HTH-type transcriptional regulator ArgP n=1 Tax=Paraburkholderia sp. USG1 TaxID=2952268 RepID=UPI00286FDEC3|nr:HTH-type transcriptional regulator ArgP [Paraburkholderia sp. USG1]
MDRQQLETLAAVIEHGSFRGAASVLNITPGAVSQRIKALEEHVGCMLLMREGAVTPTRAGEAMLRHIVALRLLEEDTLQSIRPDQFPPVSFPLAVNADSLATWFEPVAWELARHHIALELMVDDQDHTLGALARGDVMGAIATQSDPLVGFIAKPVGCMRYQCVATPTFRHRYFMDGFTVPAVLKSTAILFNRKDALHDTFLNSFFGLRVGRYVKHYFPSPVALLGAIVGGIGYGLVPSLQAAPLIGNGVLVDLTPSHALDVELYWHHWKSELQPMAGISEIVMNAARAALIQAT